MTPQATGCCNCNNHHHHHIDKEIWNFGNLRGACAQLSAALPLTLAAAATVAALALALALTPALLPPARDDELRRCLAAAAIVIALAALIDVAARGAPLPLLPNQSLPSPQMPAQTASADREQTPPPPPQQTMARTTTTTKTPAAPSDPYISLLDGLASQFVDLCDLDAHPASDAADAEWQTVIAPTPSAHGGVFSVAVHQKPSTNLFFRVVVDLDSSPEEAFDTLADISLRPSWDETCESADILEVVSPTTKIQYMRTKGFWPTSPRAAIVVAFVKRLSDGRYINVTQSIDSHPAYEPISGEVRMTAKIAGVLVGPHPTVPNASRCFQLMDGDLGGWLPKSVVALVTTQAFPISLRRVNKILRKIDKPKTVSAAITEAEQSTPAPNANSASAAASKLPVANGTATAQPTTTSITKQKQTAVAANTGAITPRSSNSLMKILNMVLNILKNAQPVMVFLILISIIFKRRD